MFLCLSLYPLPCTFFSFYFPSSPLCQCWQMCQRHKNKHLWIMLSPFVMELKGCFLCLEYDMLSRGHLNPLSLTGCSARASDYPFVFQIFQTPEEVENFFKRNWSAVANLSSYQDCLFSSSQPYYSQIATPTSFLALSVCISLGGSCVDPHFSASEGPL